jgi:serine/threonine protein kinase
MIYPTSSHLGAISSEFGVSEFQDDDRYRLPLQLITPPLYAYVPRLFYGISKRHNWNGDSARRIMQWAISQPKTALLLWMCDDLPAWKLAAFYLLGDNNMPFKEKDLRGIAADPQKVVELQWKFAMKQLPRNGQHVEFQIQDAVPLQECGLIIEPKTRSKKITKVRYLDSSDDIVFVRKRYEFLNADRPNDKRALLRQIKEYNRLEHEHLVKIISSYHKGQVVAFVYPFAQYDLGEYLSTVPNIDHSTLMHWIVDLADAIAYVHSQGLEHRSIRPQKILVDTTTNSISFSPFGISPRGSTYAHLHSPYSNDPCYIYAAPEVISNRDIHLQADVFSLGCCFLDIMTVARGQSLTNFTNYRSALTQDMSFHANLDSVSAWIEHLKMSKNPSPPSKNAVKTLSVVKAMLNADAAKRPIMQKVVKVLNPPSLRGANFSASSWTLSEPLPGESAIWSELSPLQEYYRAQSVYGDE